MRILPSQTAEWVTRPGPTLSQVIWFLPECCTFVTLGRALTCNLMVMLETRDNENEGSEGGQYACTEEVLYKKAIALLEKCKVEARSSGQKVPESTAETSPTAAQRPGGA